MLPQQGSALPHSRVDRFASLTRTTVGAAVDEVLVPLDVPGMSPAHDATTLTVSLNAPVVIFDVHSDPVHHAVSLQRTTAVDSCSGHSSL